MLLVHVREKAVKAMTYAAQIEMIAYEALKIVLLCCIRITRQTPRRWNDDVVFKGQARTEPETKKRFVNDTIRNDFHRRFLTKYIK